MRSKYPSAQAGPMTAAVFILLGVIFCLGVFYLAWRIINKADKEKE